MGEEDRRRAARHEVYIAAEIMPDDQGKPRGAVTRDVSATGALLLTRAGVTVGSVVRLRVFLPGREQAPLLLEARVIRDQELPEEEVSMWRRKAAIEFLVPQPELAEVFHQLSERQKELMGR